MNYTKTSAKSVACIEKKTPNCRGKSKLNFFFEWNILYLFCMVFNDCHISGMVRSYTYISSLFIFYQNLEKLVICFAG